MWRALGALAAGALAFSAAALAQVDSCVGEAGSLRAHAGRYTVHFRAVPPPAVGRHFAVVFSVCGPAGAANPDSIIVDARMPSHGHGMNYRPTVAPLGGGRYRAEGLMFHMPGEWELTFVVQDKGVFERITYTLVLR